MNFSNTNPVAPTFPELLPPSQLPSPCCCSASHANPFVIEVSISSSVAAFTGITEVSSKTANILKASIDFFNLSHLCFLGTYHKARLVKTALCHHAPPRHSVLPANFLSKNLDWPGLNK